MKLPAWAPGLVLFIGVLLMTLNLWRILLSGKCKLQEGFASPAAGLNDLLSSAVEEEKPPNETEAVNIYRQLLMFVKKDYTKGIKIVYDMNQRIYGKYDKIPNDFDPRKVLDNWKNPLTGF